jgi:hypothetical protein
MLKQLLLSLSLLLCLSATSQVKIGDNPGTIAPGSLLELESTTKALTLPRMTTVQMQSIETPVPGMIIFNTDSSCIYFYKSNNQWAGLNISAAPTPTPWPYHSNNRIQDTVGNRKGIIALTGIEVVASGDFSHAEGRSSLASGDFSLALGDADTATNYGSVALGVNNKASGDYTFAAGLRNIAAYQSAVAMGQDNKDSGWASLAMGYRNTVHRDVQYSSVIGFDNLATVNRSLQFTSPGSATFSAGLKNVNSGYGSIALGSNCKPSNTFSLAANFNTLANASGMSAFGHYNDTLPAFQGESYAPGEMLFSIGNGTGNLSRRNSFTMLRNGFTSINATPATGPNIPRAELDVKGTGAMIVPVGTSAQRPVEPVAGMIRLCTDCGTNGVAVLQGYDGTDWVDL